MANYKNILVIIEDSKDDQLALSRAVYLAKKNDGKIKAFLAIYDFTHEVTTLLSQEERMTMRQNAIEQRISWIKHISRHHIDSNILIEIKVVWDNNLYKSIIDETVSGGYDLILKEAHKLDRFEAIIHTPVDWQLLRKCPCDVWMVKNNSFLESNKLLVAVNLSNDDDYYGGLNDKLINSSLELAEHLNKEVHLMGAYPETAMNIAVELPEFNPTLYKDAIRGQYLLAMKALRQKFSIREELTHVIQGLPNSVIPQEVTELNVAILVLGTIGRTGFSAAFIGNTAEHVMNHVKCDLLVIKPDNLTEEDLEDEHDDEE